MNAPMPEELSEVYEGLSRELSWLYAKWDVFKQLYADSMERIALLRRVAPGFFGMVQRVFIDDILLSIARLTDPLRTRGRGNLSLPRLLDAIEPTEDRAFHENLKASVDEIQRHCEPFRDQRNRRIAHSDLNTILQQDLETLPPVTRTMIEDALQEMAALLNLTLGHYENTTKVYDGVTLRGDGKDVVFHLQQAIEYEQRQHAEAK